MPYKNIEDKRKYYKSTKILKKVCKNCGRGFLASKYKPKAKFCSKTCQGSYQGKINGKKIGDKLRGTGTKSYIKYKGQHLHRYLMEQKLGRKLKSNEIVHHKDENKFNNKLSNLVIVSRSKHGKIHGIKNRICKVRNCNLKHNAKGYCHRHYRQVLRLGKVIN